jgi:hypothetical protein
MRRIEAMERKQRELGPSIAKSFQSTVADLLAAQATLTSQQARLSESISITPAYYTVTDNLDGDWTATLTPPSWASGGIVSVYMTEDVTSTATRNTEFAASYLYDTGAGIYPRELSSYESLGTALGLVGFASAVMDVVNGTDVIISRHTTLSGTGTFGMDVLYVVQWF